MKLTKRQKELLGFIKQRTSLSLHNYVVNKSTTTKYIVIDLEDSLTLDDLMSLSYLSEESGKFKTEGSGHKKLTIMLT